MPVVGADMRDALAIHADRRGLTQAGEVLGRRSQADSGELQRLILQALNRRAAAAIGGGARAAGSIFLSVKGASFSVSWTRWQSQ